MELQDLKYFVLTIILIGVLIGVGIVIFDNFGETVRDETTVNDEVVAITSFGGTLGNNHILSLTVFENATHRWPTLTQFNFTSAGVIGTWTNVTNGNYNVSYTYDKESSATRVTGNMTSVFSDISSQWMGLIVTVAVLAIVLSLVVGAFGAGKRG